MPSPSPLPSPGPTPTAVSGSTLVYTLELHSYRCDSTNRWRRFGWVSKTIKREVGILRGKLGIYYKSKYLNEYIVKMFNIFL